MSLISLPYCFSRIFQVKTLLFYRNRKTKTAPLKPSFIFLLTAKSTTNQITVQSNNIKRILLGEHKENNLVVIINS